MPQPYYDKTPKSPTAEELQLRQWAARRLRKTMGETPEVHAATHAHGGYDVLTAAAIDALPETAFSGLTTITVSDTPPSSPSIGDVWIDTSP